MGTALASSLKEEKEETVTRLKTPNSPSTKKKAKTLGAQDPLSVLLPRPSKGASKFKTVGSSSFLKEKTLSKKFLLPKKILPEDLKLILAGEKIKILGRKARLARVDPFLQPADEIRENKLLSAILIKSDQADGHQRITRPASKTVSGHYKLYDERTLIMPDITLAIEFLKIKA